MMKDYDLDDNGNRKEKVCYSSGDRVDEDWRKPKRERLYYKEYKKQKRYRQTG